MKPTASRRICARSASPRLYGSTPARLTVPDVGESRRPVMFSKVVFPEPDRPTIATNSPGATRRSTSKSNGVGTPRSYVLLTRVSCATHAPSCRELVCPVARTSSGTAHNLDRIDARRAPCGIQRGQKAHEHRERDGAKQQLDVEMDGERFAAASAG